MGDSENAQQTSKKRGALNQLSRDNPALDDEEDSVEFESGTFKKASDEVLASRRIVKVKRKEPSVVPATAPNPFAGIKLVTTTAPASTAVVTNPPLSESKLAPAEEDDEVDSKKTDVEDVSGEETKDEDNNQCGKKSDERKDQTADPLEKDSGVDQANGAALSSFQQHSSIKNAFTGLASTEASGSSFSFSFGLVSQDGSTGSGSLFGFALPSTNNSSLFSASSGNAFPPKEEVSTETGEENEKVAFSADSVMFEHLDGRWKERGKGELKVNVSSNCDKARLVMRSKGNYRLILNASIYPEMKLASMDKKGITFACVNSIGEGNESLSTFALKFKDPTFVEEFRVAIQKHQFI